jgi:ankyrin repeat protein
MNSNYFKKYFKYKNKYLLLKNKLGGSEFTIPTYSEELVNKFTDFLNLTCNQLQNADNLKDIEVINFFLPKQYNIKKKDETTTDLIDNEGADFRTLLIHACSCLSDDNDGHDKPQLIIDLLEKGADMNAKDINGWNALMHASANGSIETCTVLLDKGASPDSNNSDNNNATNKTSALILAVHEDNIQLCLLLISRFADINLKVNLINYYFNKPKMNNISFYNFNFQKK